MHRLTARAFVHNPHPDTFDRVNHIDGNKKNNCASNLEWIDAAGNSRAAVTTGAIKTKDVYQYHLSTGAFIEKFDSARLAAEATNGSVGGIRQCASGIRGLSSGGYRWTHQPPVPCRK
jgi:hypothetical protein